jgi:hypothetical protein
MDAEASREQPGTAEERTGLLMVELSNAMVQLYKELFGPRADQGKDQLRRP